MPLCRLVVAGGGSLLPNSLVIVSLKELLTESNDHFVMFYCIECISLHFKMHFNMKW